MLSALGLGAGDAPPDAYKVALPPFALIMGSLFSSLLFSFSFSFFFFLFFFLFLFSPLAAVAGGQQGGQERADPGHELSHQVRGAGRVSRADGAAQTVDRMLQKRRRAERHAGGSMR